MWQLCIKPIEWFVLFLAYLAHALIWLWIVSAPVFTFVILGGIGYMLDEQYGEYWFFGGLIVGCLLGIGWAEWVRKRYGCIEFMGKLLSTPEIEGWRTAEQQRRKVWVDRQNKVSGHKKP